MKSALFQWSSRKSAAGGTLVLIVFGQIWLGDGRKPANQVDAAEKSELLVANVPAFAIPDWDHSSFSVHVDFYPGDSRQKTVEKLQAIGECRYLESFKNYGGFDGGDAWALANQKHLKNVVICSSTFDDEGLKDLKESVELEKLVLAAPVTGSGFWELRDFNYLRELDLQRSGITDENLAALQNFPNLTILRLSYTGITDAGLRHLSKLHFLEHLSFIEAPGVTTHGLTELNKLTSLRSLSLPQGIDLGKALAQLTDLRLLESLGCFDEDVSDDELRQLVNYPNIQWFEVRGSHFSAAGIRELVKIPGLKYVELNGPNVTGDCLKELSQAGQIRGLSISGTQHLSDDDFRAIGQMQRLERLFLHDVVMTNRGIDHLKNLKSLQNLTIDAAQIDDGALDTIAGLEGLDSLTLCGTKITADGLRKLDGLRRLRYFHIEPNVESAAFLKAHPHLERARSRGSIL